MDYKTAQDMMIASTVALMLLLAGGGVRPNSRSDNCMVLSVADDDGTIQTHHDLWSSTRRKALLDFCTVATTGLALPLSCHANEDDVTTTSAPSTTTTAGKGTRPYASLEALMPAVRVKLWIDQAVALAQDLQKQGPSSTSYNQKVEQLQTLLLEPPKFNDGKVNPIPSQPGQTYLDAYNRGRSQLDFVAQPGARLVQNGEIDTWKRLKRQEQAREKDDEIRAALNAYTTSLTFSADNYLLNVSPLVRSQMIRQENLPDVKQVIASDMGMRYLYRNNVLTAVADAKAEMKYLISTTSTSTDGKEQKRQDFTDLIELLQQAQTACTNWFSLIEEQDVKDALDAVELEGGVQS